MEVVSDLTTKLEKMDDKDQWYLVDISFAKLLAESDEKRPIEIEEEGWGEESKEEEYTTGTPETQKAPLKKKRTRKGTARKVKKFCWTFFTRKNNKGKKETEILLVHFGGPFGHMKMGLRRTIEAMKKVRYDAPPLALIAFHPQYAEAGPSPPDSMNDGARPVRIMTPRPARGTMKSSRVDEYFDYIAGRTIQGYMKVDATCPLNEEKVLELLKSLKTLDNFGPAKRGKISDIKVQRITLTPDERLEITAS